MNGLLGASRLLIDAAGANKMPIVSKTLDMIGLDGNSKNFIKNRVKAEKDAANLEMQIAKIDADIAVNEVKRANAKSQFMSKIQGLYTAYYKLAQSAVAAPGSGGAFQNSSYKVNPIIWDSLDSLEKQDYRLLCTYRYLKNTVQGSMQLNMRLKTQVGIVLNAERTYIMLLTQRKFLMKKQQLLGQKLQNTLP